MSTENHITKVYLALDCLLDTRLGVLATISPDFAFEVTTKKSYFMREEDKFGTPEMGVLNKDLLAEVLKKRPEEVIRNSLRTKIPQFVREICTKLFFQAMSTPFHAGVEIDVNVYPHKFNDVEAKALIASLVLCFGKEFTLNLISKSDQDLTVDYVHDHYRCVIMYVYHEWMNVHQKEIQKKPLKTTGFYVPRLYFLTPPTEEALQEFADHNTDLFKFTQTILGPLVPIQFLPVALFCADTPSNKPEYSAMVE